MNTKTEPPLVKGPKTLEIIRENKENWIFTLQEKTSCCVQACLCFSIYSEQTGCFGAASELYWAELGSDFCSVCVKQRIMQMMPSPLPLATLRTCWFLNTPQAWVEVHTRLRSSSLPPRRTCPRPRCSTAGDLRCPPAPSTSTSRCVRGVFLSL